MPEYTPAESFIINKLRKELAPTLTYHGIHHTLDVLNAALIIAAHEGISEEDVKLLRIAVCFHDAGFVQLYKGHEEKGCAMAKEFLPLFGFDEASIQKICNMIMATKLPQQPHTHLEEIIADADLDYLGRDDFFRIGNTLYQEFKIFLHVKDEEQWNRIQLDFLQKHHYHTAWCKENREPGKQERLHQVEDIVKSYGRG